MWKMPDAFTLYLMLKSEILMEAVLMHPIKFNIPNVYV